LFIADVLPLLYDRRNVRVRDRPLLLVDWKDMLARPEPPYRLFRGIMPGWDNTPRRPYRSHVFVNAEPTNYGRWRAALVEKVRASREGERLIFVNAWNEWGEGCHLEPDARYGRAFLEATARALA